MHNKKIMVIDDEPAVHRLLQIILEGEGFDIIGLETHGSARKTISRSKPDLIILDIMMPEVDGFDVLRMLKSDEETGKIPVIILTSSDQREEREKAKRLGAEAYMTKPFKPSDILMSIRSACEARDASPCSG